MLDSTTDAPFIDRSVSSTPSSKTGKPRVWPAKPRVRRARRACTICRARKVRCYSSLLGAPCTNCSLDNLNCVMAPRKRQKVRYQSNVTESIGATYQHFHIESMKINKTVSNPHAPPVPDSGISELKHPAPIRDIPLWKKSPGDQKCHTEHLQHTGDNTMRKALHDHKVSCPPPQPWATSRMRQKALQYRLEAALLYVNFKRIMRADRIEALEVAIDAGTQYIEEMSEEECQARTVQISSWTQVIRKASEAVLATDRSMALVEATFLRLNTPSTQCGLETSQERLDQWRQGLRDSFENRSEIVSSISLVHNEPNWQQDTDTDIAWDMFLELSTAI